MESLMIMNSLLLALCFYGNTAVMNPPSGETACCLDKHDEVTVRLITEEDEEPGVETWTNTEGKQIRGTFISGDDNILTLKLENGKEAKVPFEKLSEESRARARVLAIRKALRPK